MQSGRHGAVTLYSREIKQQIAELAFSEFEARRLEHGFRAKQPSESEIATRLVLFALAELKRQGYTRIP